MRRACIFALAIVLGVLCQSASAQSYEFQQGYIFKQSYVDRISVDQAEQIVGIPGFFKPLLTFEWVGDDEVIKDSRIKRDDACLVFDFGGEAKLSLADFSTNEGDGDLQTFKYITSVPGFHVVGVEYGHDQPQFLLVPEVGGRIYFVDTN